MWGWVFLGRGSRAGTTPHRCDHLTGVTTATASSEDQPPSQSAFQDLLIVQSLSRVQLCDTMDYSMPGSPPFTLLELAQTHVH